MARINPVELTPSKPGPQVEDEVQAGSDDERAADLINASLRSSKKPAPKERQSSGLLDAFNPLKYLRRAQQPTVQDVEAFFYPPEGSTNTKAQAVPDADENEDIQISRQLAHGGKTVIEDSQEPFDISPTIFYGRDEPGGEWKHAANVGKRKVDIYEFDAANPENSEEGGEFEESRRPAKRVRGSMTAEHRGRNAGRPVTTQRETRANARAVAKKPASMQSPRRTGGVVETADEEKASYYSPKRRGRPRKAKAGNPEAAEKQLSRDEEIENQGEGPETDTDMPEGDADHEEPGGVSDILLHPSPVKPIIPVSQVSKSKQHLSRTGSVHGTSSVSNERFISLLDDSDEDDAEAEATLNDPVLDVAQEEDDAQDAGLPKTLGDILPIQTLEDMLKTVQRVGHKQDQATKEWTVEKTEANSSSVPGKRLMRRLGILIEEYTALPMSRAAGGTRTKKKQDRVDKVVASLLEEAEVIFKKRLGSEALNIPQQGLSLTQTMLRDIYFFLVPNLVKVLKLAVEAYQDEELAETAATNQVIDILCLLRNLGERATQQPKTVQLKSQLYRTSEPTRSINPIVRKLYSSLKMALNRSDSTRKNEMWNAGAPERKRKQAAQEEREVNERNRNIDRIHRQQRDAYRDQLNDPGIHGFFLKRELEKRGLRLSQSSQYRPSQRSNAAQNYPDDDVDMSIEDGPFDDGNGPASRMTPLLINASGSNVLGSRQANKHHGPKPFSQTDKAIAIKTLRYANKAYRYQLAAQRLGRGMEEIIDFAKIFQESMDKEHENGRWNTEEDVWTCDIWVEKA